MGFSSPGTLTVLDEGVVQGAVGSEDFTGTGVAVTVASGRATINIPQAGSTIVTGLSTTNSDPVATANTTAINNALAAADAFGQGGVVLPWTGASAAIYINGTLIVPSYVTLEGQGRVATIIKVRDSANLEAIIASDSWYNNDTASGGPVFIRRLQIDGNKANQASGAGYGVVIMNYRSQLDDIAAINTRGDSFRLDGKNRNAVAISNTLVETKFSRLFAQTPDGYAFHVSDAAGKCTDGILENSEFSGTGAGLDCVRIEAGAGWVVRGVHPYGTIDRHAINVLQCFATEVSGCHVEHFGNDLVTSGHYAGIRMQGNTGRGSRCANNTVHCDENGHASNTYSCIFMEAGNGATFQWTCTGNDMDSEGATCRPIFIGRTDASGANTGSAVTGNKAKPTMTNFMANSSAASMAGIVLENNSWQYQTAIPTTGTWGINNHVWNSAPAGLGVPGWVCTAAGTPGTWKTMAALGA